MSKGFECLHPKKTTPYKVNNLFQVIEMKPNIHKIGFETIVAFTVDVVQKCRVI